MDKQQKVKKLEELFSEIAGDENLPLKPANLVFGEGDPDSKVMFIGEAPGQKEDELMRPFVGRAGQVLEKMITGIGWKREDVYITNIVKRRPPNNRDPLPEEIALYQPYLARQIEIINPIVIATLGRFSMNYFLPEAKITRDQGKLFLSHGRYVYPLFHPAAALRSTGTMDELRASFDRLPRVIKQCEKKGCTTSVIHAKSEFEDKQSRQANLV